MWRELKHIEEANREEVRTTTKMQIYEAVAAWKLRYFVEYIRLQASRQDRTEATRQLRDKESQLVTLQETFMDIRSEVANIIVNHKEHQELLAKSTVANDALDNELKGLREELDLIRKKVHDQEQTIAKQSYKAIETEKSFSENSTQLGIMKKELEITRLTCQELIMSSLSKDNNLNAANEKIEQQLQDYHAVNAQYEHLKEDHQRLLDRFRFFEEDVWYNLLPQWENRVGSVNQVSSKTLSELSEARALLRDKEEEHNRLQAEIAQRKEREERLVHEHAVMSKLTVDLSLQLENLRKEHIEAQATIRSQAEEIREMRAKHEEVEQSLQTSLFSANNALSQANCSVLEAKREVEERSMFAEDLHAYAFNLLTLHEELEEDHVNLKTAFLDLHKRVYTSSRKKQIANSRASLSKDRSLDLPENVKNAVSNIIESTTLAEETPSLEAIPVNESHVADKIPGDNPINKQDDVSAALSQPEPVSASDIVIPVLSVGPNATSNPPIPTGSSTIMEEKLLKLVQKLEERMQMMETSWPTVVPFSPISSPYRPQGKELGSTSMTDYSVQTTGSVTPRPGRTKKKKKRASKNSRSNSGEDSASPDASRSRAASPGPSVILGSAIDDLTSASQSLTLGTPAFQQGLPHILNTEEESEKKLFIDEQLKLESIFRDMQIELVRFQDEIKEESANIDILQEDLERYSKAKNDYIDDFERAYNRAPTEAELEDLMAIYQRDVDDINKDINVRMDNNRIREENMALLAQHLQVANDELEYNHNAFLERYNEPILKYYPEDLTAMLVKLESDDQLGGQSSDTVEVKAVEPDHTKATVEKDNITTEVVESVVSFSNDKDSGKEEADSSLLIETKDLNEVQQRKPRSRGKNRSRGSPSRSPSRENKEDVDSSTLIETNESNELNQSKPKSRGKNRSRGSPSPSRDSASPSPSPSREKKKRSDSSGKKSHRSRRSADYSSSDAASEDITNSRDEKEKRSKSKDKSATKKKKKKKAASFMVSDDSASEGLSDLGEALAVSAARASSAPTEHVVHVNSEDMSSIPFMAAPSIDFNEPLQTIEENMSFKPVLATYSDFDGVFPVSEDHMYRNIDPEKVNEDIKSMLGLFNSGSKMGSLSTDGDNANNIANDNANANANVLAPSEHNEDESPLITVPVNKDDIAKKVNSDVVHAPTINERMTHESGTDDDKQHNDDVVDQQQHATAAVSAERDEVDHQQGVLNKARVRQAAIRKSSQGAVDEVFVAALAAAHSKVTEAILSSDQVSNTDTQEEEEGLVNLPQNQAAKESVVAVESEVEAASSSHISPDQTVLASSRHLEERTENVSAPLVLEEFRDSNAYTTATMSSTSAAGVLSNAEAAEMKEQSRAVPSSTTESPMFDMREFFPIERRGRSGLGLNEDRVQSASGDAGSRPSSSSRPKSRSSNSREGKRSLLTAAEINSKETIEELRAEFAKLTKDLKKFKQDYIAEHGRPPAVDDFENLDNAMKIKIARKNQIKKLLGEADGKGNKK
eukprot:scaffold681_cov173-Ochromonas_danica.AAC.22